MLAIEVAVLRDHLRLEPDAEPHSHPLDLFHQIMQTAGKLGLIDKPVSQSGTVVVPLAEPAVIQHQHIYAKTCRLFCNVQDLFGVKAKIGRLPVVYQHRTLCQLILSTADMFPDCLVEVVGQGLQSGVTVGQHDFRRGECLSGFQFPAEQIGVNAHYHTHLSQLVALQPGLVAAAVNQCSADARSGCFRAVRRAEQHRGILVVAGCATGAADLLDAVEQQAALHLAFHGVSAVKMHPLPAAPADVQAKACRLCQRHRCLTQVADPGAACHQIQRRQDCIQQGHFNCRCGVPENHFQRLCLVLCGIHCRQPFDAILSRLYRVAVIAQIQGAAAVCMDRSHRRHTEIAYACSGIFQRQRIQRIGAVVSCRIDVSGKSHIGVILQIGHIAAGLCAVPEMPQHAVGICLHLVHGVVCLQGKDLLFCINLNCHSQHS